MMNRTMQCPVCNGAIGYWSVVRAPTPTRLRCPQCRSRLQIAGRKWPVSLVGVLIGAIVVGPGAILVFAVLAESVGIVAAGLLALCTVALLVFLLDLPLSWYVVTRRQLQTITNEKPTTA